MTFEQFHNGLRLLLNLEGGQLLELLTPVQIDNFYSNPHMFFIRADDTTARKLWDVMYPKPKGPATGEVAKDAAGVVVDLDAFRKAVEGLPKMPEKPRDYRYWCPPRTPDYEYDTGRVVPAAGTPPWGANVSARAG